MLSAPRTTTTLGMRSFAVAGPVIWNSLPAALQTATLSPVTFAWHLKAHLFGWLASRLRTIYDALYKSTHHHHHHRHCIQLLKCNGHFVNIVRSTHHTTNSSHSQLVSCDELTDSDSQTNWVSRHQKVKQIWILLSKRWSGGSGISWTICISFAPCFRQITMPASHHSVFKGQMFSWCPLKCQSTQGKLWKFLLL